MTPERPGGEDRKGLLRYAGLGIDLAVSTLVGGAIGWWLDGLTGMSPVFLVVFMVFGAIAGFLAVYRAVAGDDETTRRARGGREER